MLNGGDRNSGAVAFVLEIQGRFLVIFAVRTNREWWMID
ncbi:hypothetical protein PF005_g10352 [Phytophthora fragariae]|uniref:Uncharacterized protein n=1 Tax=Phytophthora fragariae TaxID=53985 RepID=A0A6A3ZDY0_9STRA|nr:hypothetical protein PF011_g9173 [Phytophthora fragariae]KAE9213061.1 hypothetical protein PF005_g10352 [Phytophthora fragariae]KAE9234662.1 hypothetical protein PF004_g9332 [Phytophthora fragariae]KAE9235051.1 hypothetical protein PF002_g11639 [Phytophthora fragariae]